VHALGTPVDTAEVAFVVNGDQVQSTVPVRLLLSDFLRDGLGLTGTHVGCEHGVCGACTVALDGAAVRSCLLLAVQADGAEVVTIEGLTPADGLSPMQEAFRANHALQCGFCTPGFLVTLAVAEPADYPDEASIRELLAGNLCRCTGYQGIVDAVREAWSRDGE
jgi:carbon-monoxide dehydrogenase small subunit